MSAQLRVSFLGLGIMGSGMANRLLQAGFPLTVYNRSVEKAATLAQAGAKVAATPKDAAANADVVISMVADDMASGKTWLGRKGALAGALPGTTLVECSTLTVGWVKELAEAAAAKSLQLVDAPVTGSKSQAANGEVNFLVGGDAEALEKVRPALAAMGKNIYPVGPTGSGALLKLINNFLCGVQMVSVAEALVLIEKSGLDRTKALEVLQNGAPGSPLIKNMPTRMINRDYTPNFLMRLMAKDLKYVIQEGRKHKLPLATAAIALNVFNGAILSGRGDQDFSAVVEQYRKELPAEPAETEPPQAA